MSKANKLYGLICSVFKIMRGTQYIIETSTADLQKCCQMLSANNNYFFRKKLTAIFGNIRKFDYLCNKK